MSAEPEGEGLPEDIECDFLVPSLGVCFRVSEAASTMGVSMVKVGGCLFLPGFKKEDPVVSDPGLTTFLDPCPFFFFSFFEGEGMGDILSTP